MPTAKPMEKRSRKSPRAESTQYCARDARTKMVGPTKKILLRPSLLVSQPPRKPPKKIPISAEAAMRPCQNSLRLKAVVNCSMATPTMLST
ncbi:hypothetical protein D9M70_601830 [compost metagenome]